MLIESPGCCKHLTIIIGLYFLNLTVITAIALKSSLSSAIYLKINYVDHVLWLNEEANHDIQHVYKYREADLNYWVLKNINPMNHKKLTYF